MGSLKEMAQDYREQPKSTEQKEDDMFKDEEIIAETVSTNKAETQMEVHEVVGKSDKVYEIQEFRPMPMKTLPSKEEVIAHLKMYEFVKNKIIKNSDIQTFGDQEFIKKSGWRKFVKAFNVSIELIEKRIFELEEDLHAEVRVRALLPNGQHVEGFAIKSKSEFWSEKRKNFGNYTMHNLVSTAWTRAVNRAISDLVGFGEVSAEEIEHDGNIDPDSDEMF